MRLQAQLTDYPRYKVLSPQSIELADLQAALRPGEGYYKMMVVGDELYALSAARRAARASSSAPARARWRREVDALRNTIVRIENGEASPIRSTSSGPRALRPLFGPVDGEMPASSTWSSSRTGRCCACRPTCWRRAAGVDAYRGASRAARRRPFDFPGVAGSAADARVSTAVSARAFRDVRRAAGRARQAYLGFGENAVALHAGRCARGRPTECGWPLATGRADLRRRAARAEARIGAGASRDRHRRGVQRHGAIKARDDLDQYRILHFATHGLVTAPRPECPARPALMTSFAGDGSDGLLSFSEIFDLRLDADLVILSACDTAGTATVAATREAGLAHRRRLRAGRAGARLRRRRRAVGRRQPLAGARRLRRDQAPDLRPVRRPPGQPPPRRCGRRRPLMDDPETSHPFYWAASRSSATAPSR